MDRDHVHTALLHHLLSILSTSSREDDHQPNNGHSSPQLRPPEDRTAAELRQHHIEPVTITHTRGINATTRVLRLLPTDPNHTIKVCPHPHLHLQKPYSSSNKISVPPGQWLDIFIPTIPKAGGFTITSPPSAPSSNPTCRPLPRTRRAKSSNPLAKFFHHSIPSIFNTQTSIRVGGSFTHSPHTLSIPTKNISRLVLIAGGVGINPLISILSHSIQQHPSQRPEEIHFLYGTKTSDSEPDPQLSCSCLNSWISLARWRSL